MIIGKSDTKGTTGPRSDTSPTASNPGAPATRAATSAPALATSPVGHQQVMRHSRTPSPVHTSTARHCGSSLR